MGGLLFRMFGLFPGLDSVAISLRDIATLSSPGKSRTAEQQATHQSSNKSPPPIPEKAKPLAVPGNDQSGKTSAKQR